MWRTCGSCGTQIPVEANLCPHCGKKQSRFRALKWIGGGFVALAIISAILVPSKPEQVAPTARPATTKPVAIQMPEMQSRFIATIADFKGRFGSTSNELQRAVLRDQRGAAILATLGSGLRVQQWAGTLRKLDTSGEGKAIVTIRIAPELDIETANSSLADLAYSTMIEKSSPAYAALMTMSTGDKVKFSGAFLRAEADGVAESSLTISGAMTAPEFLFRFTEISKQ